MSTYKNMTEFVNAQGCDSFGEWGRMLYKVGCGAWVRARLKDGTDIYYEDARARETDWHEQCEGIRCGSIIEGADYDAAPFDIRFPFTQQDWECQYADLEEDVEQGWALANIDNDERGGLL